MNIDQTILQTPLMDVDQVGQTISPVETRDKSGPTTFLPVGPNLGGNNKGREINKCDNISKEYLTMKQADYIYRKVELGSLINKNTMKEEIDQDVELDKMDDTSSDENPYRELIVNNAGRIENTFSQMEQWFNT